MSRLALGVLAADDLVEPLGEVAVERLLIGLDGMILSRLGGGEDGMVTPGEGVLHVDPGAVHGAQDRALLLGEVGAGVGPDQLVGERGALGTETAEGVAEARVVEVLCGLLEALLCVAVDLDEFTDHVEVTVGGCGGADLIGHGCFLQMLTGVPHIYPAAGPRKPVSMAA